MALRTSRLPEALPSGGRHTRSKRPASSPPPPTAAKRRAREPHVEITNVPKTSGRSRRPVRPAAPLPEPEPEETRNVSLQPPAPPAHERPSWQLFGWGANDSAQLGMGRYSEELSKPTRNQAVEDLIANGQFGEVGAGLEAIAAGGFHSLAVSEDGAVWSFGSNDDAALGRPSAEGDDLGPGRIQSLVDEGFRAVRVVAGDCFSAALSESGELRVWGLYHSTAADGMRAFSPSIAKQPTPIQIPELANERFASIAGGSDHLVLLTVAGEVYTVGCGDSGQLGYRVPATNPVLGTIPHKVLRVSRGHRALVVGAGGYTSFFVDERGVVWGWGLNSDGQTGTGKLPKPQEGEEQDAAPRTAKARGMIVWTPQRVKRVSRAALGGASVVQIAGGHDHTLFLASDGRVFACGAAWSGQLGGGQDPAEKAPEPVPVPFPHDVAADPVVRIACGERVSAAVTRDGVLYAWGSNITAQVGAPGAPKEVSRPTVVVRREGAWRAKAVACGGQHCLGLLQKKAQHDV